jgi:hypothetical protein
VLRKLLIGLACLSASPVLGDVHLVPNPNGALAGKNVVFSPGHGRMLDSNGTWWRFQRGVQFGIQEDIHTNEIFIEYIQRFLAGAGARVASCRERSFQANEVIVDSGHAGYSETGSWTASTSATDFYGSGYRWANTEATTTATATFTPDIPEAGRYPIYVWYTQSGNRALDARFEVHHTGGVTSVEVNQQIWGGGWVFLGDFFFDAGTGGKVVLANGGSDPTKFVIADAIRFGGGIGPSGEVRWREGAKSFLTYKGYPASNGEVSIRPVYGRTLAGGSTSAWRDDYVFVSLHTNAAGGTGTSAFSYSNGRPSGGGYSPGPAWYPSGLQGKSDQLRDAIRSQVVADIRALHDPAWRDRGGSPRNAGELREARNMPSTLLELAFHDFAGDAARLADPAFRHDSARAIYKGILRFFRGAGATVVPLTPSDLRVTNLGGGELRVSWNSVNDPLEPSAAATRFKVYLSRDGRGFNNGQIVTGSSMTLSGYSPGDRVFVRVAGLNAGGEGLATRIGGAQVGSGGAMLVVDGFDRAFTHTNTNYKAIWSHDYAVEHIDALGASAPTAPIDFAENEAVASGSVDLSNYELVDWLLGRESSVNRTFDPAEQGRVETYLRGGGALLATGSEIGWDLEAKAGGVAFLHDILGVDYVRDDAGVRVANTPTGSPFSNGGPIRLHDGTDGGYDAAFPDVLSPNGPGADVALSWETAGAPGAGVAQSTPYKVVVLGFPLESVVGTGRRRDLAGEAYRFLLPGGLGTTPTTGGTGSGGSPAGPNVPTTTAPGATSAPTAPPQTRGSRSGGGSSCSLGAQSGAGAPVSPTLLLLLLLALARVRRSSGDACPPGRVVSGRA